MKAEHDKCKRYFDVLFNALRYASRCNKARFGGLQHAAQPSQRRDGRGGHDVVSDATLVYVQGMAGLTSKWRSEAQLCALGGVHRVVV